ncbi:MAG TPA: hypothetical protein VJL84_05030 [Kiloniellales bacterium]|nr:hypothetical protein [Kiloniellales bacterium]
MWALFGIVLSAAWLGAVYWWFRESYGLENVAFMLPGEMGQTLAGVVAPLALIWILIAYLRNGAGLRRLSDELVDLREAVRQRQVAREQAAARLGSLPPAQPRMAPPPPSQPQPPLQPVLPPASPPVPPMAPPPAPLRPVATPPERAPAPMLTPAGPTPLPLGSSPGTAMLPPGPSEPPADRGAGALADEVARNLERLEAAKPPQPSADVAPMAGSETPVELDPELQRLQHRVARDLNAISMDLSAVLCRKSARDDALRAYNRGHKDAFHLLVREYLSRHEPSEIVSRLAQADATSLLHTYAMKFASLVDEAKRHDPSGGQERLLRQSALGQLYGEVLRHTAAARNPLRG